jgi:hypothetical protein
MKKAGGIPVFLYFSINLGNVRFGQNSGKNLSKSIHGDFPRNSKHLKGKHTTRLSIFCFVYFVKKSFFMSIA